MHFRANEYVLYIAAEMHYYCKFNLNIIAGASVNCTNNSFRRSPNIIRKLDDEFHAFLHTRLVALLEIIN